MDKRPLKLRTFITLLVVFAFAWAIYPLAPRDYYETFTGLLKKSDDPAAAELIKSATAKQEAAKLKGVELYAPQALLEAAREKEADLTQMVKVNGMENNGDVISMIRKKASSSIRLGLDLNGGMELYIDMIPDEAQMTDQKSDNFDHYRDVAIENLRKRLESRNIFETELAPFGATGIVLRAPLVSKEEKASLANIGLDADLQFRLVEPLSEEQFSQYRSNPALVPPTLEYMVSEDFVKGKKITRGYFVHKTPEMDGKTIDIARVYQDEMGQRKIILRFNSEGAELFKNVTAKNKGKQLAIVLNGRLYCAPTINDVIAGGSAEISGSFSEEEAKGIAEALTAGSFPYKLKVNAVFDTDPTIGEASVKNGIVVGIISLVTVAIFMLIYYHFSGLIADAALALNMLLILGAMAAFGCTLTLPGIAGIVLTIGMAVDANVLIHERIREELKAGKSILNAVDAGYDRALSAVVDSNVTTLIVSLILMYFGTGAIKGFAITLCIGILCSMFSAVFVTRLLYDYLFKYVNVKRLSMLQLFAIPKFNFVKHWNKALAFSGLLIMLLIAMFVIRGKSILGIDFVGGSSISYEYAEKGNTSEMSKTLAKAGFPHAMLTYKNTGDQKILEVRLRGDDPNAEATAKKIGEILAKAYPAQGIKANSAHTQHLDGLIGKEFTKTALIAVALALVGIGIYIVLRYELSYAVASVLALLHDVLVVAAIYLACGRTLGLTTVAAFLTVIGYSINDTVVIFDRLRENLQEKPNADIAEMVNLSINQTFGRTLLTSFTTFVVVFIMWIGGSPEIADFVMVMMLGIILGTYSSVMLSGSFVAWRAKRRIAKAHGGK